MDADGQSIAELTSELRSLRAELQRTQQTLSYERTRDRRAREAAPTVQAYNNEDRPGELVQITTGLLAIYIALFSVFRSDFGPSMGLTELKLAILLIGAFLTLLGSLHSFVEIRDKARDVSEPTTLRIVESGLFILGLLLILTILDFAT